MLPPPPQVCGDVSPVVQAPAGVGDARQPHAVQDVVGAVQVVAGQVHATLNLAQGKGQFPTTKGTPPSVSTQPVNVWPPTSFETLVQSDVVPFEVGAEQSGQETFIPPKVLQSTHLFRVKQAENPFATLFRDEIIADLAASFL